jgi:hypothetical protein
MYDEIDLFVTLSSVPRVRTETLYYRYDVAPFHLRFTADQPALQAFVEPFPVAVVSAAPSAVRLELVGRHLLLQQPLADFTADQAALQAVVEPFPVAVVSAAPSAVRLELV